MEKTTVRFIKTRPEARVPSYGSELAAGADLCACLDAPLTIAPGETALLPTGLILELPEHTAGLVCARSGLATKKGLAPANKVGVIDADYRGEVLVALFNHSAQPQTVLPGERIAQLLVTPVLLCRFEEAAALADTGRGVGGFGSTGRQ